MAVAISPLSARRHGEVLKTAGSVQVSEGGMTPRQRNPLLARGDIGRGPPPCLDLPDPACGYGRPSFPHGASEGAKELMTCWTTHTPSSGPEPQVDFLHTNRKAATSHITTARETKFYRKEWADLEGKSPRSEGCSTSLSPSGGRTGALLPSDVIPDYTYGRKVRLSTPIDTLISNRFGQQFEREINKRREYYSELQEREKVDVRKIQLTTASRGHSLGAKKSMLPREEDPVAKFKLGRFQRVPSKVAAAPRRTPREDVE